MGVIWGKVKLGGDKIPSPYTAERGQRETTDGGVLV